MGCLRMGYSGCFATQQPLTVLVLAASAPKPCPCRRYDGTWSVRKTAIDSGPHTPTAGAGKSPVFIAVPPPESAHPCPPPFPKNPVFSLAFNSQVPANSPPGRIALSPPCQGHGRPRNLRVAGTGDVIAGSPLVLPVCAGRGKGERFSLVFGRRCMAPSGMLLAAGAWHQVG